MERISDLIIDERSPCDCQHRQQNHEFLPNENEFISLVTAIERKYGSPQECVVPVGSGILIKANDHMLGKRRASGSLELLVLNEQKINAVGNLSQVSTLIHNITELDLATNALCSWREVFAIFWQMPRLVHVNLSRNPLNGLLQIDLDDNDNENENDDDPLRMSFLRTSSIESAGVSLTKMNSLVLNSTGVLWDTLFKLLEYAPNLEELHLSLNDYSDLPERLQSVSPSISFPHVHNLHINHCQLKSWSALVSVCRFFPCVETLVAAGNAIASIGADEGDEKCAEGDRSNAVNEYFGCLHSLNANYWRLNSWEDVGRIRRFPLLCDLRLNRIPFLEAFNEVDRRHLLIARLPDITSLNGSEVTAEQRENAERFFLRYYLDAEEKPQRYYELENVHGQLTPLVEVDLSPKDRAEVFLVMGELREPRRISLKQSVGELKKNLQTFCHMPPGRFRIFLRNNTAGSYSFEEELKFSKIMLYTLNVDDGDEFHIVPKPDPPPRRRTSSSNSNSNAAGGCVSPVKR